MDGTAEDSQGPAGRPTFPALDGVKGAFASNGAAEPAEEEIPAATHWPSIPVADLADEWNDLRVWVVELKSRFESVDHHVAPNCWWRHNEHVEALAALRDHERASFSNMAPATAPVDWFRAFRDITTLLRGWTGLSGCGGTQTSLPAPCRADDEDAFVEHVRGRRRGQGAGRSWQSGVAGRKALVPRVRWRFFVDRCFTVPKRDRTPVRRSSEC